jgi:RNA polymerase sigma-70 factor (ECF subfamily)
MIPAAESLAIAWWASGPEESTPGPHIRPESYPTKDHAADRVTAVSPADAEIVARIVAGDRQAFDTLYLSRYLLLHRLARHWCRSADAADDLVQEIFIDLWMRRTQWTVRTSVTAYLVGALRNRLRRQFRDRATHERITDVWNQYELAPGAAQVRSSPDTVTERNELVAAVARAVETLPPRQRMAALLHWHDGLTSGEIAEVMEISDRVARKLIAAGLVRLRTALASARELRE